MLILKKIYLTLKDISWKFIVPLLIAIILSAIAAAATVGGPIIACIISFVTLAAFVGLFVGLFTVYWLKYYGQIKYRVAGLYIVPNKRFELNAIHNSATIKIVLTYLAKHITDITSLYNFATSADKNIKKTKGTVVFFVDDISEKIYKTRYGIAYKHIAGLCGGNCIIVEFNNTHQSLINTAFEYEMARVVMLKLKDGMDSATWTNVCNELGITKW